LNLGTWNVNRVLMKQNNAWYSAAGGKVKE